MRSSSRLLPLGMLCCLSACERSAPSTSDAAQVDAVSDVPPLMVTATALAWGRDPIANRTYYFQAADGTVLAKVPTDADGNATAAMPVGGYVTSLVTSPVDGSHNLYLHRVEPGDHFYDVDTSGAPPTVGLTDVTVTVPVNSSATDYIVTGSCGLENSVVGASRTRTLPLVTGCTSDALAIAGTASGQVGYVFVPGIVIDGSPVNFSGPYAAVGTQRIDVGNSAFNRIAVYDDRFTTHGALENLAGGGQVIPQNGAVSVPLPSYGISGMTELMQLRFSNSPVNPSDPVDGIGKWLMVWGAEGDRMVDASAMLIRDIATAPVFDPPTRTVTWTEGATGLEPQVSEVTMECIRQVNGHGENFNVQVDRLYAGTSFTIPALPTDDYDFQLLATDSCDVTVALVASTVSDDLLRQRTPAGSFTGIYPWTEDIMPSSVVLAGPGQYLETSRTRFRNR